MVVVLITFLFGNFPVRGYLQKKGQIEIPVFNVGGNLTLGNDTNKCQTGILVFNVGRNLTLGNDTNKCQTGILVFNVGRNLTFVNHTIRCFSRMSGDAGLLACVGISPDGETHDIKSAKIKSQFLT
jgi:hypothetical protein